MLTSSDAKWRCMWHMLIWSIVMTLVSQFFDVLDFLAYFVFAAITVIFLPVLTAIYSNTSGRRGSSLLRIGYIICDPVLACITVVPNLVLHHLPSILDEYHCLVNHIDRNETLLCLQNKTQSSHYEEYLKTEPWDRESLIVRKQNEFLRIQIGIVAPILLALSMGRRTSKMRYETQLLILSYWFIASLDAIELLETAMLSKAYKHAIFTTETIVAVSIILSNSYAIVTLCSYLTPEKSQGDMTKLRFNKKFDFVYQAVISGTAILFCEIPILVARFQVLFTDVNPTVYGTFVLWIMKNLMFIVMIFLSVFMPQIRKHSSRLAYACTPLLDSDQAVFKPEKRDVYIYDHRAKKEVTCKSVLKQEKPTENTYLNKEPKRVTFEIDMPVTAFGGTLTTIKEEDPELAASL